MPNTIKRSISLIDENGHAVHSGFIYITIPDEIQGRKRDNYIQKIYDKLAGDGYKVVTPVGVWDTPQSPPHHNGTRLP